MSESVMLALMKRVTVIVMLWGLAGEALAADVTVTVADASGKPVTDAVLAFYDEKSPASFMGGSGKIVQKNKMFNPKVTVVQTGTKINFPNEDTVRHHVYSFSPAKKFELKLYSGIPTDPVLFDQPGVVTLGCNIHDSMVGYIYIVDTPYFAKTDDKGKATLKLNEGAFHYQVWLPGHNKPAAEQKTKIEGPMELKVLLQ